MRTLTIGIDPGKSGAWAEIWPDRGVVLHKFDGMSDAVNHFSELCRSDDYDRIVVVMEKVGGYIAGNGNPGSAMFTFGENFGFWQGLCMALSIPLHLVTPQKWQNGLYGVSGKKGPERKRALKEVAARLYPNQKVTLKNCDALLIARWGRGEGL